MTDIRAYMEALQSVITNSEGIIYPAERATIRGVYRALETDPKTQLVHGVLSNLKGVRDTVELYKESKRPRAFLTMAIITLEELMEKR